MDRLRQRADFLAVANGARVSNPAFALQARRREDPGPVPSLKGKSRRGNARIRRGSEKVRSLPETFHAG